MLRLSRSVLHCRDSNLLLHVVHRSGFQFSFLWTCTSASMPVLMTTVHLSMVCCDKHHPICIIRYNKEVSSPYGTWRLQKMARFWTTIEITEYGFGPPVKQWFSSSSKFLLIKRNIYYQKWNKNVPQISRALDLWSFPWVGPLFC